MVVDNPVTIPNRTGKSAVGFDFGLKTYLTGSDGTQIEHPQFLKHSLTQLKSADRALSRKKRGSNNRKRAKKDLFRVHRKIVNRRTDWMYKTAHQLTDTYDHIYLETLNLKAMQKLWGRKINDLAFADFVTILHYVASQKGVTVHHIDPFFASSKICHACGYKNKELTLKDRHWQCPSCGTDHDRDRNAAHTIFAAGASAVGGEIVRPALVG
jgi:putative transposase